jgi:PIN domain nuclease of toxin-antitoxin system
VNYLLDTHAFLWMLSVPERLGKEATALIQNPDRAVFVSAVTSVEISIKRALGKLDAPAGLAAEIPAREVSRNSPCATLTENAWPPCPSTITTPLTACSSPRPSRSS